MDGSTEVALALDFRDKTPTSALPGCPHNECLIDHRRQTRRLPQLPAWLGPEPCLPAWLESRPRPRGRAARINAWWSGRCREVASHMPKALVARRREFRKDMANWTCHRNRHHDLHVAMTSAAGAVPVPRSLSQIRSGFPEMMR